MTIQKEKLIKIAAVLVQCNYLPSSNPDDYHQKRYSAEKVARMMEKGHNMSKDLAIQIRAIADSL